SLLSNHLWMQPPHQPWHLIDHGLSERSAKMSLNFMHSLLVDSGIHLATDFGLFDSYDSGATWTSSLRGFPASTIYSYFEFPSGRRIMTTNLGLFERGPSDMMWSQQFPLSQYLAGIPVFADNAGRLYLLSTSRTSGFNTLPQDIFVSTDEGVTWQPDTT